MKTNEFKMVEEKLNELYASQELKPLSQMMATSDLNTATEALNELLADEQPKELNTEILKRIKDITYLIALSLVSVAKKCSANVRKIIAPIYVFLKSFHDELKEAINNPDYKFNSIDEPELPDFSDIDEDDRSNLKVVLDTITKALPTLIDLFTSLSNNNYPYAKEVKVIVNTVNDFCAKYSKLI